MPDPTAAAFPVPIFVNQPVFPVPPPSTVVAILVPVCTVPEPAARRAKGNSVASAAAPAARAANPRDSQSCP
uniref:CRISPR-associated protein Cas5 n=1 Tax=Actinocorallia populi TaxID=2079200 RepID=UPI0038B9DFEB